MNNDQNEIVEIVIIIAIALAVIIFGYWILRIIWMVVKTMAPHLISSTVIILFQICCSLIGIGISLFLFMKILSWTLVGFKKLEAYDAELLSKINKKSPTFVVALALISNCVLVITKKIFDDPLYSICITIILILIFWGSNQLLNESDRKVSRIIGLLLWFFALVFIFHVVMLSENWSYAELINQILKLPSGFLVTLTGAFLVACVFPFLVRE